MNAYFYSHAPVPSHSTRSARTRTTSATRLTPPARPLDPATSVLQGVKPSPALARSRQGDVTTTTTRTTTPTPTSSLPAAAAAAAAAASATPVRTVATASYAGGHTKQGGSQRPLSSGAAGTTPGIASPSDRPGDDSSPAPPPATHRGGSATPAVPCLVLFSPQGVRPLDGLTTTTMLTAHTAALQHRSDGLNRLDRTGGAGKTTAAVGGSGYSGRGVARVPEGVRCVYDRDTRSQLLHIAAGTEVDFSAFMRLPGQARGVGGMGGGGGLAGAAPPGSSAAPAAATAVGGPHTVLAVQLCVAAPVPTAGELHGDAARRQAAHVPSLTPPPGSVHVELVIRAGPANAAPSAGVLSGGSSGYRLRFTNAIHAVQRHAHHTRFPLQCVRTAQWMQLYIDVESVMRACQAHGAAVGTTSSSSSAAADTVYRVLQLRIGTAASRTAAGQAASGGVYVRRVVAGYGLPMPPADVHHLHLAAGQHSATDSEGRLWMLPEPLRLPAEAGECTTVFVRTGEETVLRTAPVVVAAAETEEEAASTPLSSPAGSRASSETARVAASAVDTTRQGPSTTLPSQATPPPLPVESAEAAGRQRRSGHRVSPAPLPRRVRERNGSDAAGASTPPQDISVTPQRRTPPHSTALEALRRRQGVREGKESGGVRKAYSAAAGAAQAFAATPLPESPVLSAQRTPSLPSSSTSSSSSTEAEVFVVREVATMQLHAREPSSRFAEEQRAVEPAAVPQQSTTVQEREGEESAAWRDDDQPWVVPDSGMHHEEAAVRRGGGATDMMPPRAGEVKAYSDNDTKRERSRAGATQALPRADDGAAPDCRTAAECDVSTTAAANAACDASSPPSAFARTRAQPRPTSRPSTSTPARGGDRTHGGKDMGADREVEAPYRDVQKDASLWATSIVSEPSSAVSCTPSSSASSSLSSSLLSTSAVAELMEEMSARVRRIHAVLAENQSMKNEEEEMGEEAKQRTAAAGADAAVKAAASLTQRRVTLPSSSRPTAGTDLPAQSPPPPHLPASPRNNVTAKDHTSAQPPLPLPLTESRHGDLADLLAKRTVLSRLPPAAPGAATPLSLLPAKARTTSAVTAAAAASGPAQEAVTTAAKRVQEVEGEDRESESTRMARGDVGVKEGGGDVLDAQAVLELWSSTEVPLQLPSFTSQPSSLPPRQHHADVDSYHPPWEHRSSNTRGDGEAAEKRPLEARPAVPPAPSEAADNTGGAAAPPWSDSAVTSWTFQSSTAANTATTAVNSAAPVASPAGALPRDEAGQSHRLPPSRQQQHVAPQEHLKELPQSVSTFQLSSKAVVWRRPAPAAAVALRHPASTAAHKAASDDVRMGEETPLTVRVRAADALSAAATGGYSAQQHRAPMSDGMLVTEAVPRDPSERGEGVLRTPDRGVVTRHSDVVAAVRHDSRAPSAAAAAAPSSHYTASSVGSFHMWLPHPMPPLAPGAARYPSLTTTATTTTATTTATDTALRIVGRESGGGRSRGDAEGKSDGPGGRPPVVRLSAATPTRSQLPSLTEGTPQAEAVMGAATTLTDAAVGEGDGAAVSDRSRPSVHQQAQAQQPGSAWPGQQAKAPLPLAPASAPTSQVIPKPGVSPLPAAGAGVVKQVRGAISGGGAEANRYMYDAVLQCFLDLETNAYVELAV